MKILEIIENQEDEIAKVKHLAFLLNTDCRPYLKEIDYDIVKYTAYRGYLNTNNEITKKKTRLNDRRPRDTGPEMHDKLNRLFELSFGHPFRNGLFVTGSAVEASNYGSPHVVFPINEFKYVWHDEVEDFTGMEPEFVIDENEVNDKAIYIFDLVTKAEKKDIFTKYKKYIGWNLDDIVDDLINSYDKKLNELVKEYMNYDLKAALRSGNEISIWCKEYYLVKLDFFKTFIAATHVNNGIIELGKLE